MSKIELTDHPYLYLSSLAEAKRNNELDRWRESHQHNMACKAAIEAAIRKDFDGMHLNADCAHNIIWSTDSSVSAGYWRTRSRERSMMAVSVSRTKSGRNPTTFRIAAVIPSAWWRAIPLYWTGS